MGWGKFYGIGVGPGDPELLTLKARRVLEEIDVLFIPKSKKEKRSLALSIVAGVLDKDWECHELILPMIKEPEILQQYWQEAALQVIELVKTGRDAAFITLGDPGMYSSFTYILRHIKKIEPQTEVEIIPGISSIHSISAWIQEPLTEGDESLLILPAGLEKDYLGELLDKADNILLMKAGNEIDKICNLWDGKQIPGKAFLVSRCGFADGFYTDDLSKLQGQSLDYLSSILIKKDREEEEH